MLKWLTFSLRPLCLDELADATAIDLDDPFPIEINTQSLEKFDVSTICPSLVNIENITTEVNDRKQHPSGFKTTQRNDILRIDHHYSKDHQRCLPISDFYHQQASTRVRLAHFSVKEYLVSERIRHQPVAEYAIHPQKAHEFIGASCLRYLSNLGDTDCKDSGSFDKHPLIVYATTKWMEHAQMLGQALNMMEHQSLFPMDQTTYLNWLRLYNQYGGAGSLCRNSVPNLLFMMCQLGVFHPVGVSVDSGEDVNWGGSNEGDEDHFNPLIAALEHGHLDIARLLLQSGVNPTTHGHEALTKTLWIWPKDCAQRLDLMRLMIQKVAPVNAPEGSWTTPL